MHEAMPIYLLTLVPGQPLQELHQEACLQTTLKYPAQNLWLQEKVNLEKDVKLSPNIADEKNLKIRAEVNEIGTRRTIEKNNRIQRCLFKNVDKI